MISPRSGERNKRFRFLSPSHIVIWLEHQRAGFLAMHFSARSRLHLAMSLIFFLLFSLVFARRMNDGCSGGVVEMVASFPRSKPDVGKGGWNGSTVNAKVKRVRVSTYNKVQDPGSRTKFFGIPWSRRRVRPAANFRGAKREVARSSDAFI